ncbi:hypothetical protein G9A89_014156 [Geosiphon pyriformis]|nr:hypothetical protein G9A89_014156 [Geosiphon pyriformis]
MSTTQKIHSSTIDEKHTAEIIRSQEDLTSNIYQMNSSVYTPPSSLSSLEKGTTVVNNSSESSSSTVTMTTATLFTGGQMKQVWLKIALLIIFVTGTGFLD